MKLDYEGDDSLATYLESSKMNLYTYYERHYKYKHPAPSQVTCSVSGQSVDISAPGPIHSPQKNFTSRFQRKAKVAINELDEIFKLPQEDFKTCSPIHWWLGRHAQFPNLFWLARDILCIPGCVLSYYSKYFLFS